MVKSINIFPGEPIGPETSVGILESKLYSREELDRRRPEKKRYPYHNEDGRKVLTINGYNKNLSQELALSDGLITQDKASQMLEAMLLGRELEKMSVMLTYKEFGNKYGDVKRADLGDITFPSHLAIGQEAMSVGSIFAVNPDDLITSTHRGHVDALVKGYRAIMAMSDSELGQLLDKNQDIASRLGLPKNPSAQADLLNQTIDIHIYRTIA